jgi:hypothetical protein
MDSIARLKQYLHELNTTIHKISKNLEEIKIKRDEFMKKYNQLISRCLMIFFAWRIDKLLTVAFKSHKERLLMLLCMAGFFALLLLIAAYKTKDLRFFVLVVLWRLAINLSKTYEPKMDLVQIANSLVYAYNLF